MFPSAGLFSETGCPFLLWGECERPYCPYQHFKENHARACAGSSATAAGKGHGDHNAASQTFHNQEQSLSELERINKQIEAVRNEVEKEQKRLSRYQSEQAESAVASSEENPVTRKTLPKDQNGNQLKCKKATAAAPKYVVDRTKPKTDLEYDPFSNYSADLRSGSSTDKVKSVTKADVVPDQQDQEKAKSMSVDPFSITACNFEDSDEEGELVIDIPLLENDGNKRSLIESSSTSENANFVNNNRDVPENDHLDTGLPLLEKKAEKIKLANKGMTNIIDQQGSHKSLCEETDLVTRSCIVLQKESVSAARGITTEGEPKPLVHPRMAKEEPEPPVCQKPLEKPLTANVVNAGVYDEKAQNIEADLDDISICLDHLRRESESIPCFQDVDVLLLDNIQSTPSCSKIHKQPNNTDISKNSASCQTTSISVKTSWSFAHKVAAGPVVQNVPLCVSETNATMAQATDVMEVQRLQKPPLPGETCETITIDSSSSEDLNYSDLDLSESDPMEECYRIFMEANKAEDPTVQGDMPEDVAKVSEAEVVKPGLVQKKRVAHVAKFEVGKSKAQVIVPLRDGLQLPVPSRSQQCHKRATSLTAAVKGGQSFITASAPKRVLPPTVIHASAVPKNCVNILPAGATWRISPNLHLIVPEGTCALPVTLIPATAVPVVRPVHQPPSISQPTYSAQPVNYTPAKSIPTKRKAKGRAEVGIKVPHDVRQRYVNLFVEEFLKTSATVQDAFEKALAEEKNVFDRSINKLKYLSIAVNALKRLKNLNAAPAKFSSAGDAQASRGNVPLNAEALLENGDSTLYDQLQEHILTKALLRENNYPHRHPDKAGFAIQYGDAKKGSADVSRRLCCRCGTSFSVSQTGKHTRKEECNYHCGKVIENRVPGGVETRYSCCENAVGSPGCQVFKLHVHDAVSLQGFVCSLPQTRTGCPGIYAIDTDMCYTTQGLELVRVTVVNSSLQVIYDTFVKPSNEVIDFNTRFSGVSEDDVKNSSSSLQDVQSVLLSFISEKTILVGHDLENDLCALKIIHNNVVDTSVVFPHRLGPPHKRDLRSLTAEYLRKIIQESADGHDAKEDATACMELILWKVKEDGKGKRW